MATTTLVVTAPHATSYDADYPTRSVENYAHALHDILQDMEDAGPWYLGDEIPSTAENLTIRTRMWDMVKAVFDYADTAITGWRASETPGLTEPTATLLEKPVTVKYVLTGQIQWQLWADCMKMLYKIYYMWATEEDPLLLKEKLQELLLAWPLTDMEISLNDTMGQSLRVVPAWKNVDI